VKDGKGIAGLGDRPSTIVPRAEQRSTTELLLVSASPSCYKSVHPWPPRLCIDVGLVR
jgi:hypothetical protein